MAIIRSSGLLWFSMGIFLLLCSAKAEKLPYGNVNLAPFQQWENAYKCMANHTGQCLEKQELNITGVVSISQDEISRYCNPDGCLGHIYFVLTCINNVKRDFKFANGYKVDDLNRTITNACNTKTALQTPAKASSATKGLPLNLMTAQQLG